MNSVRATRVVWREVFGGIQQFQFTILIITFLLTVSAMAQWVRQSPLPTHLQIRGVAAPTAQRVFLATDDNSFDNSGALFESTDGGATWTHRDIPTNLGSPLNGIFFLDSNNGWAFGNDNYRTTDGGTTWTQLPFIGSTYGMTFYTSSFGLANLNFDRFISRDGGLSWESSPNGIFAYDFATDLTGLGVSSSGIYRTLDGGTTFNLVHSGEATSAAYLSASVAVAIVDSNFVRSTDGGATWQIITHTMGRNRLTTVSENVILAWGRSGIFPDFDYRVLHSEDGGQTWSDLGEILPEGPLAFTVVDPQNVVASDQLGNMFHSADAGFAWVQTFTSPGPRPGFLSSAVPVFSDASTGYFGYGAGFVIKTTDGGNSWSQISSGSGQSLNDVDRFPDGRLIAVGESGTLLTSTGTGSWRIRSSFTPHDLVAVQVLGATDVVTVDAVGRVYSSIDAGSSWQPADTLPPNLDAEDLYFSSLSDGWVTGTGNIGGALYHTTDGGASWTAVPGFGGLYTAVDFVEQSGWAANVNGRFYHTTDSGTTWQQGDLPGSPLQISDMDFFDAGTGYAVGRWGYAARSEDGGLTWDVLPTPNNTDNFTDIYLISANELWLSTTSGFAYYSANGGQNWAVLDIGSDGFDSFSAIAANPEGDAWTVGFQGYIEHFMGPPPPPLNRPPDASFDFIASGLTVDFTDTSSDPDGSVVNWFWDFGDSTFSTERHPSHTFPEANTYIVRLTVTDDDGDSGSAVKFIAVQPGPGGTFGDFTEVTPLDSLFVTPQDEDFWVITTAPADYDGDGDLDIAVLGYYVIYNQSVVDRLVLLRNDGSVSSTEWEFSYIDVPLNGLTTGRSDLTWGDMDGDGDQDLALGTNGATIIYRNDDGTLNQIPVNLPGYSEDNDQADFDLRSLSWADYDNDGDADLLIPSVFNDTTFSYRTALMRNDGDDGNGGWLFTETNAALSATTHAQSIWADYDGDQDLDLLLVNIAPLTDTGYIRRYRNDGNGAFFGEDILDSLSIEHGEAQWGDYDADGDLDVLIAGNLKEVDGTFTHQALRIYQNDNEIYMPFEVITCLPCGGWFDVTAATWADYDTDGDIDILIAGTYNSGSQIEGRARIYDNHNGNFTDSGNELPAPRASGTRGGTFSWLDIDGEGDLDYFIAGQYFVPGGNGLVEAQMHAYRNDSPGQNAPPSAPSSLNATVQNGGTVAFSWMPASDDHTPSSALSYALDLYKDGLPAAIPGHLPQPGNVTSGTQWALNDLPDGHYEWTLRAVDAAYSGSPVATGAFNIGATDIEPSDNLPTAYRFDQNYPNPFNPETTLRFALPERAHVNLVVYNLKGERVAELANESRTAGVHEIRWDAAKFASGIYFARISTNTFTKTRRIILLK